MAIDAADHVPMALEVATERPGPQLNALQGAGAISAVVIFADLGHKKGAPQIKEVFGSEKRR